MTAEIQVLRFYPGSPGLVVPDGLKVRFLTYGPSVTMFINGYPPPLPRIESGHVLIFPLQENKNPSSDPWQLIADSGADMTIPARAEIAASDVPPATGRNFLAREMANMFSRGAPRDVSMAAGYLGSQYEDLTAELMPLLDAAIGNDRERWAEVAANLFAAQPTPRPSVADLLATKLQPNDWPGRQSLLLAQAALQKFEGISRHERSSDPNLDCGSTIPRLGLRKFSFGIRRQSHNHRNSSAGSPGRSCRLIPYCLDARAQWSSVRSPRSPSQGAESRGSSRHRPVRYRGRSGVTPGLRNR
jgi:hypothetical protein